MSSCEKEGMESPRRHRSACFCLGFAVLGPHQMPRTGSHPRAHKFLTLALKEGFTSSPIFQMGKLRFIKVKRLFKSSWFIDGPR